MSHVHASHGSSPTSQQGQPNEGGFYSCAFESPLFSLLVWKNQGQITPVEVPNKPWDMFLSWEPASQTIQAVGTRPLGTSARDPANPQGTFHMQLASRDQYMSSALIDFHSSYFEVARQSGETRYEAESCASSIISGSTKGSKGTKVLETGKQESCQVGSQRRSSRSFPMLRVLIACLTLLSVTHGASSSHGCSRQDPLRVT